MSKIWLCLLCLTVSFGCGDPSANLKTEDEAVTFEAMDTFQSSTSMAVGYPAEMGDWNAVKNAAASDEYSSGVTALESAELPTEMSDKQAERDAVVAAAKKLQEVAKAGGTKDEIETSYKSLSDALSKFNN